MEGRAWLAAGLARGERWRELEATLRRAHLAPGALHSELRVAASAPATQLARRLTRRMGWLESLLGVYGELHRQSGTGTAIERRTKLSAREFFSNYYFQNRPVLIDGLLDGWPALRGWSLDFFAERFGGFRVEVMVDRESVSYPDLDYGSHRRRVRMRELIRWIRDAPKSGDVYLMPRNELLRRRAFRPLLSDIPAPVGYFRPEHREAPGRPHLWLGPGGTRVVLHHDHVNILFCQVFGRKRFWMTPAFNLPRVYNERGNFSAVNVRDVDAARFPRFREVRMGEVVVGPGQALFIPVGWWHMVQALSPSASVTFTGFALPAENAPWKGYWLGPGHGER